MRISIWQEFSSNHSSRFTVVGIFETPQKAELAAAELRHISQTILDWYDLPENAQANEDLESGEILTPSPPEIQIAAQYGIEWTDPTPDWLWNGELQTFDQFVLLHCSKCDFDCQPADALIEKMGGRALIDGTVVRDDVFSEVHLTLTCVAPDEAIAQRLYDDITAYFQGGKRLSFSSFEGKVWRHERALAIEDGRFSNIAEGLPAVIRHFREAGCHDISYRLAEIRDDEIEAF